VTRTALLLAGRRPGVDAFAAANGTTLKALIPVAGRPMLARVVETLLASPEIGRILILTQDVDALRDATPTDDRVSFVRSGSGIARSIAAVAGGSDAPWPLFVTTADHALLTPEIVAEFLGGVRGDASVAVVERSVVEARFPKTKRTWLRFRGGAWTGANLFAFDGERARAVIEAWSAIEQDRKKGWKLVARFGIPLLLRALTRTITIQAAAARAGRSLGAAVTVVALGDARAAVDVDKPSDLALATAVLEGRA
jgi:GTP:adenosylcobinamide-phosphate guanylyltransferase